MEVHHKLREGEFYLRFTPFSFFVFFGILASWFGVGKRFPFALLGPLGETVGAFFWALVTLFWFGVCGFQTIFKRFYISEKQAGYVLVGGACLFPLLLLFQGFFWRQLGYSISWLGFFLDSLGVGIFLKSFLTFQKNHYNHAGLKDLFQKGWALAVWHRVLSILIFPLLEARSDMLPVVSLQLDQAFHTGEWYGKLSNGVVIPYLPGLIMGFLPPWLVGLDLRWAGVASLAALGWFLSRIPWKSAMPPFLCLLWVLNPYLAFRHELHLDFFFLSIVWGGWHSLSGHSIRAVLGGMWQGLTYQVSWFWLPFFAFAAGAKKRDWSFLGLLLGGLLGSGILILPFWSPRFLPSILHHLERSSVYRGELCLGFAALAFQAGAAGLLKGVQIGSLLGVGVWGLLRWIQGKDSARVWLQRGVVLSCWAIAWHGFIENYLFLGPLLLGALVSEDHLI